MTLSQYFSLVDVQARMALKSDASRYFLGYIWWVLEPLLYVAVFYVLFNMILDGRREDFLVFLMCGKLTFVWFSRSVTQASNAIVTNPGLIGASNIPKSLFPVAIIQEGLYKQALVFLLLFVVLAASGYNPGVSWLQVIPLALVQYIMIVGCSLVGAVLVCLMRDFSLLIGLGMMFLLFTSGIFWDVRELSDPATSQLMLAVNPLAFMLDAYREALMYGGMIDFGHLALVALGFAALTLGALRFMHSRSQWIALRALS